MRNSTILVVALVLGLVASSAFAGHGYFGGCGGSYYSGCGSYYSGCGSYYSAPYYNGCGQVYRTRTCAPTTYYYSDSCCEQTTTAVQKTDKPTTPPKSSPLPPEPRPAVEEDKPELPPDLPKPPKEELTFNIRIMQPNGEMLTARVKNGFMPQIRTIDGQRWAVYDARIPFAKYRAVYEQKGYITYVSAKPQQSVLVATR